MKSTFTSHSAPTGIFSAKRKSLPLAISSHVTVHASRREVFIGLPVASAGILSVSREAGAEPAAAPVPDFVRTPSGLLIQDIKEGSGVQPKVGDVVVVDWSGRTKGYQGKMIGNSTKNGEPFEFKIGAGQAIAAFEEAVLGMRAGGIRRIELPGELMVQLGYPMDRSQRYTNDSLKDGVYKYKLGPEPQGLGGERALDFVLDNKTLQPFNRTLLFDVRLAAVRPARR